MHFFIFLYSIACLGCLFLNSELFNDSSIVPRQYFGAVCLCLLIGWMVIRLKQRQTIEVIRFHNQRTIITTALLCVFAQTVYAFICFFNWPSSMFQGSYDNPAGLASSIACVIPFVFVVGENWRRRKGWIIVGMLLTIALIMSQSRAGLLAVAIPLLAALCRKFRIRGKQRTILVFASFLLLSIGLYFLKRDSAEGRLLIWRCSLNLFLQRPIFGWGPKGFMAHYMDAQAGFLATHPHCSGIMLADNVHQPFNEWIGIAVRYGVVGLIVTGVIFVLLFICYRRSSCNQTSRYALMSLSGLAIFACFSYPFTYSFVWIIVLTDVAIIIDNALDIKKLLSSLSIVRLVRLITLLGCLLGLVIIVVSVNNELTWKRTQNMSLVGNKKEAMQEFALLEKKWTLGSNPYFLYNYAVEKNIAGDNRGSLEIAMQCRQIWADYDLQLLIGQNYEQLDMITEAEKAYMLANNMCPCRFYPLYLLALLYERSGRHQQAIRMAETILEMQVKVPSATVNTIKARMQKMLSIDNADIPQSVIIPR